MLQVATLIILLATLAANSHLIYYLRKMDKE